MKTLEFLFVGGVLDGEKRILPNISPTFKAAKVSPGNTSARKARPPVAAVAVEYELYRLEFLAANTGERFLIYRLETFSNADVIRNLITSYAEHKKLKKELE